MRNQTDEKEYRISRFDRGVMLLPYHLRERARMLCKYDRMQAEEFRFRLGQPMSVLFPEGERFLEGESITKEDLSGLMDIVTQGSKHTVGDSMRQGYITVRGGYRLGLCGTGIVQEGKITGLRSVSSVCLRIPKEIRGLTDELLGRLSPKGEFTSTLILSPPGGGKTTLLRDMIRTFSNGDPKRGLGGLRFGVSDERGEISGMWDGVPQMDLGIRTDILDGCPKDEGLLMLLRGMNPQVIALDEITAERDIDAMEKALHCGVKLLATAHAERAEDLKSRGLYRRLLDSGVFHKCVVIRKENARRVYEVEELI